MKTKAHQGKACAVEGWGRGTSDRGGRKNLDRYGSANSEAADFERRSETNAGARKRGGQPGNSNAVTHGRYSAPRRAERKAAAEERERHSQEWQATIPQTDYGAICDAIKARPAARRATIQ